MVIKAASVLTGITSVQISPPKPLVTRREPPIAFALGLFSGLLAMFFMRALGTPDLDAASYVAGVVIAAICGVMVGWGVRLLRPYPRFRRHSLLLVIGVGAFVGMTIQTMLLVRTAGHVVGLSSGLSTGEPIGWILAGVPLGALPAVFAAALLAGADRLFSHQAHDARERLFFPFATASAVLGALGVGVVDHQEKLLVGGVIALAVVALGEIFYSDIARARWLRDVFAGSDVSYEVVPLDDEHEARGLSHVVGGVVPLSVIMQRGSEGYRVAARTPLAATGITLADAIAPLKRRALMVSIVLVAMLARAITMLA